MKGGRWMVWAVCGIMIGVLAGGCAKKILPVAVEPEQPAQVVPEKPAEGVEIPAAEAVQPEEPAISGSEGISETNLAGGLGDVFFSFDQYVLDPDARSALERNARYLQDHTGLTVAIEGHADERGTNEYNLALAERRAQAVKRYLEALGIDSGQARTVSYGEEKPFCSESGEDCWSRNRRAHFSVAD